MMNKASFIFLNGLAVLACGLVVMALVEVASGIVLYGLNTCSLFADCRVQRELAPHESSMTQFAGGILLMFAFSVYGFLAFAYWAVSSYEGLRHIIISKHRLFIAAVVVPSFISVLFCWIARSDFFLLSVFITAPFISFLAFQSHWRVLLWLKKTMIDNGRNGEIQCLN